MHRTRYALGATATKISFLLLKAKVSEGRRRQQASDQKAGRIAWPLRAGRAALADVADSIQPHARPGAARVRDVPLVRSLSARQKSFDSRTQPPTRPRSRPPSAAAASSFPSTLPPSPHSRCHPLTPHPTPAIAVMVSCTSCTQLVFVLLSR